MKVNLVFRFYIICNEPTSKYGLYNIKLYKLIIYIYDDIWIANHIQVPVRNGVTSGTLLKVAWPQARIPSSQLPKFQFALRKMWNDMLVGGIPTPLKNMKVSWDDYAHILWKNNPNVPNHQPDMNFTSWSPKWVSSESAHWFDSP